MCMCACVSHFAGQCAWPLSGLQSFGKEKLRSRKQTRKSLRKYRERRNEVYETTRNPKIRIRGSTTTTFSNDVKCSNKIVTSELRGTHADRRFYDLYTSPGCLACRSHRSIIFMVMICDISKTIHYVWNSVLQSCSFECHASISSLYYRNRNRIITVFYAFLVSVFK